MTGGVSKMPLEELRRRWFEAWGIKPHARIGRLMLEKSLDFKLRETRGAGLSVGQQKRLAYLAAAYKRDPKSFEQGPAGLKPGVKLLRTYNGQQHVVVVKPDGFEYQKKLYTSLSQIASDITGTRWNGRVFFGLKRKDANEIRD
ncbi:MAG TPA: DUF2924 domain-containing protein [Patescibacteria group bacterium]|nr:DUF2924 domain-containing protein [Patescibacteria group bacterium]